jgi:hypothetical protein
MQESVIYQDILQKGEQKENLDSVCLYLMNALVKLIRQLLSEFKFSIKNS